MDWQLCPNDANGDQDFRPLSLSKQDGIQRGVIEGNHYGGWWCTGESGHDCPGPTSVLYHWVDALSRAEWVELWFHHWKTDPSHQNIPPPYTLEHLLYLVEALKHFWDQNPIVLGELNANTQYQNPRNQQVAELLMEFGLVDLRHHLRSAGGSIQEKWSQMRNGILLRKIFEDIYESDGRRVDMVGIRDGRRYALEHFTGSLGSHTQQRQANNASKGTYRPYMSCEQGGQKYTRSYEGYKVGVTWSFKIGRVTRRGRSILN